MFGKEFEIWTADLFPDVTLIIVGIYVTNLSYLKDRPLWFIKLLDGGTKESNKMLVGLNIVVVIPKIDNQDLLN